MHALTQVFKAQKTLAVYTSWHKFVAFQKTKYDSLLFQTTLNQYVTLAYVIVLKIMSIMYYINAHSYDGKLNFTNRQDSIPFVLSVRIDNTF